MNEFDCKLVLFMKKQGVDAEHLVFDESCHSVEEAAAAAGVRQDDFVKSICMIGRTGNLIVAVVKGEDRADRRMVGELLGEKPPRLAKPDEILECTGYPCGGTPPFGFAAAFIIDERVLEREVVYAGGGTPTSLIKVRPADIERLGAVRGLIRSV